MKIESIEHLFKLLEQHGFEEERFNAKHQIFEIEKNYYEGIKEKSIANLTIMTAVKQPNQDLYNYLSNELNVIATQTEMQEIEAIVIRKHEQQIKDAYNQGYRDGKEEWDILISKNIAESNAQIYYNITYKK